MILNRTRFSIIPVAVLLAALVAAPRAQAGGFADQARNFIDIEGNLAIQAFGTKDRDQRYAKFRSLLTKSFAIRSIAKYVIGRFWNTATKPQRKRYLATFEDYMVANYAAKAWNIKNVNLSVEKVVENSPNDVFVATMIHIPHKKKDVPLGFRVRNAKAGPKIVDLQVDGISLIVSHRSEFTSVMGKYGGDLGKFNDFLVKRIAKLEKTAQTLSAMELRKKVRRAAIK